MKMANGREHDTEQAFSVPNGAVEKGASLAE